MASRERLRDALAPPSVPMRLAPTMPARPNAVQRLLHSLRTYPVVGDTAEAVAQWWVRHPFRPVARIAGDASLAAVTPIARRHPLALVGVSAAVGAVVVWAGPWRWAVRTVLFAGLVPQLATKIVSKLPINSWLTMLGSALAARNAPATAPVMSPPLRAVTPSSVPPPL